MPRKKNLSKKRIVLTDRDLSILRFLFEQKISSQNCIMEKFFFNRTKQACVNRMQKLIKYRYINKGGIQSNGVIEIIYTLTDKGLREIKHNLNLDQVNATFKSDSPRHDIELSKIRVMFESFKMVDKYFSENSLQNCFFGIHADDLQPYQRINSDAALKINVKEGSFFLALEYERSIKKSERYTKKLMDYYLDNSITAVFYLCSNKLVQNTITKIDKEVSKEFKPKVYTLNAKDMQKPVKELAFKNSKNGIFTLK